MGKIRIVLLFDEENEKQRQAPCAARNFAHLSVVSSRQRSIMIGEDVRKNLGSCYYEHPYRIEK